MNNNISLESLVMDLKRTALGYNRGSTAMAQRFSEEAQKRRKEIDETHLQPYLQAILHKLDGLWREQDKTKIAEDSLMFSTLLQNYLQKSV